MRLRTFDLFQGARVASFEVLVEPSHSSEDDVVRDFEAAEIALAVPDEAEFSAPTDPPEAHELRCAAAVGVLLGLQGVTKRPNHRPACSFRRSAIPAACVLD